MIGEGVGTFGGGVAAAGETVSITPARSTRSLVGESDGLPVGGTSPPVTGLKPPGPVGLPLPEPNTPDVQPETVSVTLVTPFSPRLNAAHVPPKPRRPTCHGCACPYCFVHSQAPCATVLDASGAVAPPCTSGARAIRAGSIPPVSISRRALPTDGTDVRGGVATSSAADPSRHGVTDTLSKLGVLGRGAVCTTSLGDTSTCRVGAATRTRGKTSSTGAPMFHGGVVGASTSEGPTPGRGASAD
jgi:hypothetical protein